MHRVYAPDAQPPEVAVQGSEAHHLARVLRLRAGDAVRVFDGRGREWHGRVSDVAGSRATIALIEPCAAVAEPPVHVTLAVAVLKGDQMDAVVRDATMLGAAAIVPFVSAHVAVPERAWRNRSTDRWARVALASARQSRRSVVPDVLPVTTLTALLDDSQTSKILCVEPGAAETTPLGPAPVDRRGVLFVGPEGGWAAEELERARAAGAVLLGLGPRTLRAESAPIVALTALWTTWGWEGPAGGKREPRRE